MILRWLIFCFITGFPLLLPAQIGIKAGLCMSNISYTEKGAVPDYDLDIDLRPYLGYDIYWVQLGDQKQLLSPYISIYYNVPVSKRLDFVPEISYMQKGVDFSQSDFEKIIYRVKINYIEIPLSLNYRYVLKEKFHSGLSFGGYGAFNVKAVKKTAENEEDITTTQLDQVKTFDAGIQFGLNFKYRISNNYILLDIRFSKGLTDIFTIPDDQVQIYHQIQNSQNNATIFSLGYEF